MTADTSWYGQQTLVHPDYSHQPYAPYGSPVDGTYPDPYAGHDQFGHVQQYGYQQPYNYAQQYGYGHGGPYDPGHAPQPDYYAAHHEPTLIAEYGGYPGHNDQFGHGAYQGYDTQHGYAPYPGQSSGHPNRPSQPDYGMYDTVADVSFTAAADQSWAYAETAPLSRFDGMDGADEPALDLALDHDHDVEEVDYPEAAEVTDTCATGRAARRRGARRRSAVLTIAVPSIAVLGVAGAAAATMGPLRAHHHDSPTATASKSEVAAQAKAQALAGSEARDAAERAARDKARTALQLREAAARKAAAEAPRFVLPISFHSGLSALFGQAGTHWMQLHTGIDFPVPEGTPVHAVTGGTVATEWNPFYGYMVKLTAPDGTVTWYCHLSSYRVRGGHVRVGEIIAYSGDSGNSTGPHLHFEVHPDGGPAVDPLPWLLARGLDPR